MSALIQRLPAHSTQSCRVFILTTARGERRLYFCSDRCAFVFEWPLRVADPWDPPGAEAASRARLNTFSAFKPEVLAEGRLLVRRSGAQLDALGWDGSLRIANGSLAFYYDGEGGAWQRLFLPLPPLEQRSMAGNIIRLRNVRAI